MLSDTDRIAAREDIVRLFKGQVFTVPDPDNAPSAQIKPALADTVQRIVLSLDTLLNASAGRSLLQYSATRTTEPMFGPLDPAARRLTFFNRLLPEDAPTDLPGRNCFDPKIGPVGLLAVALTSDHHKSTASLGLVFRQRVSVQSVPNVLSSQGVEIAQLTFGETIGGKLTGRRILPTFDAQAFIGEGMGHSQAESVIDCICQEITFPTALGSVAYAESYLPQLAPYIAARAQVG